MLSRVPGDSDRLIKMENQPLAHSEFNQREVLLISACHGIACTSLVWLGSERRCAKRLQCVFFFPIQATCLSLSAPSHTACAVTPVNNGSIFPMCMVMLYISVS